MNREIIFRGKREDNGAWVEGFISGLHTYGIHAQAYGARISRLEGVKARIYIQLRKVGNYAEKKQKTLYTNTLQSSYYTNIYNIAEGYNCGIDFTLLPQRAIDKVLREPWHDKNYSDRVWIHNGRFIQTVQDTITNGITSGHSVSRMAESLTEYVKSGNDIRNSTEALVRSETSHFMNQGQKMAYEEAGISRYRFVAALSSCTCDRCAALDGKPFDLDKAVEGKNYPPLHTNCRCITIPADAVPSKRIARDPVTGKNYKVDGSMTFEEWKNSLTDEQRKAMELHVRQMKNKSADKKQYEKYISIIGKENMPKTFDVFQDLKYNDIGGWAELQKYISENRNYLQQQLSYVMPNGEKNFIPDHATMSAVKTIAGAGSKTELRVEQGLVDKYGGALGEWRKRVGKIESEKYIFDVHWYELDGKQYEMKLKNRGEKKL